MCTTYTDGEGTIEFSIVLKKNDDTEVTVNDDTDAYNACISTATGFCINHDKANRKIQWHVF